jgi:hypothetical protein
MAAAQGMRDLRTGKRTTTSSLIHTCQGAQEENTARINDQPCRMAMQACALNTHRVKDSGWSVFRLCLLCTPCHSTVHHIASDDELARDFYTVDLLLSREDILKPAKATIPAEGDTTG